jgi:hypothetical protein
MLATSLFLSLLNALIVVSPVFAELDLGVLAVDRGFPSGALPLKICAFFVEVHPPPLSHIELYQITANIILSA